MSEINLGRVKGDPFTYEDFTAEQLEALKGNDGVGISAITQTLSTEDGGISSIDISLSNGTVSTVYVKNGSAGKDGTTADVATDMTNGLMSSSDKAKLDAITATATELNYCSGATSNIQTQIDDLDASVITNEDIDAIFI